jgi:hypothetical protein
MRHYANTMRHYASLSVTIRHYANTIRSLCEQTSALCMRACAKSRVPVGRCARRVRVRPSMLRARAGPCAHAHARPVCAAAHVRLHVRVRACLRPATHACARGNLVAYRVVYLGPRWRMSPRSCACCTSGMEEVGARTHAPRCKAHDARARAARCARPWAGTLCTRATVLRAPAARSRCGSASRSWSTGHHRITRGFTSNGGSHSSS